MSKKNSKIIFGVAIFLFITFFSFQNVYAASGYGFSVGTRFSAVDGDSSVEEAQSAHYYHQQMGFTSTLLSTPTFSTLRAKTSDSSRYLLESDLLFFLGHANSTTIYWDYMGKGGDYAIAIKNDNSNYCDRYWTYVGLGNYNMSKVTLGVFMGCSTAANSTSNLPKYANSKGATVTIGWTVDIPQADTYLWTSRFYSRLNDRYTVSSAINYANSFTYSNSKIKNTKVYGNSGTVINPAIIAREYIANDKENILSYDINKNLNISNLSQSDKMNSIGNIIKKTINDDFNINDFIVETAQNDNGIIYDYYYTVNGIKTNVGYTVFVNSDETKIETIVDNMNDINTSISTLEVTDIQSRTNLLSESRIESMREKAIATTNTSDSNSPVRTIIDEYKYYDIKENKLYYNIVVEVVDPIPNTKAIEYYKEEI